MTISAWFVETLEWLSTIFLYPNAKSWNILNVVFFMVMVLYGCFFLRKRFGFIRGGMIAIMLAFALTSVQDELTMLIRFNLVNERLFLKPYPVAAFLGHWIQRWSWRVFVAYFTYRYAKQYGIFGDMLSFTRASKIWSLIFLVYVCITYVLVFNYNGFRSWQNTGYPLWFVYLFGDIVVWQIRIASYVTMWRK